MQKLEVTKESAVAAYKNATKEVKALLETLFGKEIFTPVKITDRVKTFEDAASIVGISDNLKTFLEYNGNDSIMLGAQAMAKLSIIAKALNEGWEPDWTNDNEYKYYPWFNNHKAGFGFSSDGTAYWSARTYCGSRLCFNTRELAVYAGQQFLKEYNQFLTLI